MTSCTVEMKVFTDTIGRKPLYRKVFRGFSHFVRKIFENKMYQI
jgi:hypothetical protein